MSTAIQQPGRLMYQYKPIANPYRGYLQDWKTNQLWMSDPANFNDPLDVQLKIEDLTYRGPYENIERLRSVVSALLQDNSQVSAWFFSSSLLDCLHQWVDNKLTGNLLQEVRACLAEYGVSCFTDTATHPLMWSHYADQHQGYVIEYHVNEMEMAGGKQAVLTQAVEYVSQLPTLCLSEVLLTPHQALGRMLATKSSHWAYENEWRIISPLVKGANMPLPDGMRLSALIAGQKMTADDLVLLKQKADEFGVPMRRVRSGLGYEMRVENC